MADKDKKDKIDFVLLWVDGSDINWQKEKAKYDTSKKQSGINAEVRYRNWDNLKYWFRGVEKFAPWVNKVYFITWGHLPKWLNTNNPKLKIVNHKDYILKEYLPTFSSRAIILNLHRIKTLKQKFVVFDDDIFLINNVKKEDFFKNNLPCDNYNEINLDLTDEDSVFANNMRNNYKILNKYFNKREIIFKHLYKYINPKYGIKRNLQTIKTTLTKKEFFGINNNHIAQPFLKKYFNKLWDLEPELLDKTCKHKFRNEKDINPWLIRYFQLMDGNFIPRNYKIGKFFIVSNDNNKIVECIKNQKYKLICINDSDRNVNFEKSKKEINNAFESILSEKSKFEK